MPPKSNEKPINSKFEFWAELPNKMRTECVKRMDFTTRMRLRATSKKDKELVEAAPKYQFDIVFVHFLTNCDESTIVCEKFNSPEILFARGGYYRKSVFFKKLHQLLVHILKFSIAKNLDFSLDSYLQKSPDNYISKFLTDVSSSAPFHFKKVTFCCDKFKFVEFFLENCISAESIGFVRNSLCYPRILIFDETKLDEFLDLPVVINAKTLQLVDWLLEDPFKIIKRWLNTADLKLGKTLHFAEEIHKDMFEFLKEEFDVVSETNDPMRLRTNDATKHILVREVSDDDYRDDRYYYSFRVIPSNQKESEYEKDDEWIKEVVKMEECREEGVCRYFDDSVQPDYEPGPFGYNSSDDSADYFVQLKTDLSHVAPKFQ